MGRLHLRAGDSGSVRSQCGRTWLRRPSPQVSSAVFLMVNLCGDFQFPLPLPLKFCSLTKITYLLLIIIIHSVRDPLLELQELFCRQTPGPRAYHSMLIHEDRLYILGGKQSEKVFLADAWYRGEK